jgi:uncharacterized protein (TIGR02001 family)
MRSAQILGVAALIAGSLLAPMPAAAQQGIEGLGLSITTTPAVTSDYLFRGISQTRNQPAIQLTVDVEHDSGFYIGAFASNVAFPGTNLRQELDLMAGYRFELAGVKLDAGATWFTYPGYEAGPGGRDWSWWELNLRGSYELDPLKLLGQVSWSPNFNFESGSGWYVEGGVDAKLDFGITASLRVGYQWIEYNTTSPANHGSFGAPDYAVFSFGFSKEIAYGVVGALTLSHTSLTRADCFGGQNFCGTRAIATISRPF